MCLATTCNLMLRYAGMLPVRKSWESARNIPGRTTDGSTAWSSVFCRTDQRVLYMAQIVTAYRSKKSQHASLHRAVLLWQKNPNSSFFRHVKGLPISLVRIWEHISYVLSTEFSPFDFFPPINLQSKICWYLKCLKMTLETLS